MPVTGYRVSAAAVTRAGDREQLRRRELRQRLQLRLHQHHLVGVTHDATANGAQPGRTEPTIDLSRTSMFRVVFERLFGEGGTTAERLARMQEDRSILDAVREDMHALQRSLGPDDRTRVTDPEYLDAVREIERRIQRTEAQAEDATLPEDLSRPVGVPDSFDEHAGVASLLFSRLMS